jgi:iron complex transport system substrate-binding protein
MRLLIALALLASTLCAQPQRIVSTSPVITETLFALGLGTRVVGVSTYCHFPQAVERLPKVGTYLKPNVEVIARLKPDLVIVETLPNSVRDQLRSLSLPVVEIETGNLKQNFAAMIAIGKASGVEASARAFVERLERDLSTLRRSQTNQPKRSVAFIVGRTPGRLEGLVAVGPGSYLSELIDAAGGRNAFDDATQAYVKISVEAMLRRNPDVIIDMGEMADTVGVTDNAKSNVVKLWASRPTLKAVQRRRVHAIASDIFVVPGPRMIDAAHAIAEMLR